MSALLSHSLWRSSVRWHYIIVCFSLCRLSLLRTSVILVQPGLQAGSWLPLSVGFLTDMPSSLFIKDFLSLAFVKDLTLSVSYLPGSRHVNLLDRHRSCQLVRWVSWFLNSPISFLPFLADESLLNMDLFTQLVHAELLYFTRCLCPMAVFRLCLWGTCASGCSYLYLFLLLLSTVLFQGGSHLR